MALKIFYPVTCLCFLLSLLMPYAVVFREDSFDVCSSGVFSESIHSTVLLHHQYLVSIPVKYTHLCVETLRYQRICCVRPAVWSKDWHEKASRRLEKDPTVIMQIEYLLDTIYHLLDTRYLPQLHGTQTISDPSSVFRTPE